MKISGMLHVDREAFDSFNEADADLTLSLHDTGHLLVVEVQDGGWAVINPYPEPEPEVDPTEDPQEAQLNEDLLDQGEPLGGQPLPVPPGFGNLG